MARPRSFCQGGGWAVAIALGMFCCGVTPAPLGAQSLFATRGLGFPMQPLDSRSHALGGVGLGLPGSNITWSNPAAVVGLPAPGFLLAYQYDSFSAEQGVQSFDGKTARFPLVLVAFPAGERIAFQAGFGSFLDQNWSIQESDTLELGGDRVGVTDWSQSTGGVTRLRFGVAASPLAEVAVGLGMDAYTGTVLRTEGRSFPGEPRPACCDAEWDYSGLGLTAGLRWSPTADSGVGAAFTYGGKLTALPQNDSVGVGREWELPLTFQGGASGRVGANLLVLIGGSWSGWSNLDESLAADGGAQNSWAANVGLEWDGLTADEAPIPIRLGLRTATLPFQWNDSGEEWPTERAASFGLGVNLAGGAATSDFSVEYGTRGSEAVGLDESFWRLGFSVRVLGR